MFVVLRNPVDRAWSHYAYWMGRRTRPGRHWIPKRTASFERMFRDDGRWIAEIPALPGVLCYGVDRDEAVAKVQALALRVIAERLEHREAPAEFLNVAFHAA